MPGMKIILISGLPASGKTTVGKKLAEMLKLPLYGKDDFKEIMFDTIGWEDLNWSEKIGSASLEIMYELINIEAAAGKSLIAEGNFQVEKDKERFEKLQKKYSMVVVEVMCEAPNDLLAKRFKERAERGDRHPGHRDKENMQKFEDGIEAAHAKPLNLGKLIKVETADFSKIDYDKLIKEIKE